MENNYLKKLADSLENGEPNDETNEFRNKINEISEKADKLANKPIEELEELVNSNQEDVAPVSMEEREDMEKTYNSEMSSLRLEEEMLKSYANIENKKTELANLQLEAVECEKVLNALEEKHAKTYGAI